MKPEELSSSHHHKRRAVTQREARRQQIILPIVLLLLVVVAGGLAYLAWIIQVRSLDFEGALRVAQRNIAELGSAPTPAVNLGPQGENNPQALATVQAFPERLSQSPPLEINGTDPILNGLKRVLRQAGESHRHVPNSLRKHVTEAVHELGEHDRHLTVYRRMEALQATVQPILGEYQLPPMLVAIAWVESEGVEEYSDPGTGRAGLWGLTREVAQQHGLDISSTPDPRMDMTQSTLAARSYLIELYHRQGGRSWLLAAMAYQKGPAELDRLKARRLDWSPETLTFGHWYSAELMPWDLRPYVYKVLAAAVLWEQAELLGIRPAQGRIRGE